VISAPFCDQAMITFVEMEVSCQLIWCRLTGKVSVGLSLQLSKEVYRNFRFSQTNISWKLGKQKLAPRKMALAGFSKILLEFARTLSHNQGVF
jgi:hypothetical protein